MKTERALKGTWVDRFLLMVRDRESNTDMAPGDCPIQASAQGALDILLLQVPYPDNYRNPLTPHSTLRAPEHKINPDSTSTPKCMLSSQFFHLL